MQSVTLQCRLRRRAAKVTRWSARVVDRVNFMLAQFRPLGGLTFPQRRDLIARVAAFMPTSRVPIRRPR